MLKSVSVVYGRVRLSKQLLCRDLQRYAHMFSNSRDQATKANVAQCGDIGLADVNKTQAAKQHECDRQQLSETTRANCCERLHSCHL